MQQRNPCQQPTLLAGSHCTSNNPSTLCRREKHRCGLELGGGMKGLSHFGRPFAVFDGILGRRGSVTIAGDGVEK